MYPARQDQGDCSHFIELTIVRGKYRLASRVSTPATWAYILFYFFKLFDTTNFQESWWYNEIQYVII